MMMFDCTSPFLDGTQTESESEDEVLHDIQSHSPETREYNLNSCPSSEPLPVIRDAGEMCLASVEFLKNFTEEEARDSHAHPHIAEAVDYILGFVDPLLSWERVPHQSFTSITELLRPAFLARLFSLRNVFRRLAANELTQRETDVTIICWADELIVKLCACILHLATGGRMQDVHKVSGIQSIKAMQDSEARRSASLLPVHFDELADLLSPKTASPATARMALILLYGAYILREQYRDPSLEEVDKPSTLSPAVSKHVAKHAMKDTSPAAIYPSVLAEYAMTVSLYVHHNSSLNNPLDAPFASHHEHILIELTDLILDHCSNGLASRNSFSGPLLMLLNDLGVMRWFWERWGDGSTSVASTALQLTRLWIQHYGYRGDKYHLTQFDVLWMAAPCSFQALLHVLNTPSGSSLSETEIVERICDAYILLSKKIKPGDLRYEDILAEVCKKICPYILVQDDNEHTSNLRELIIEFLVTVGPDVLRTAYGDVTKVEFRWNNRGIVEQTLQIIAGMIAGDEPDVQVGWTERQTLRMKHLLDILVVFLHAKTCAASAVVASTTFMPTLIPWASRQPGKRPFSDATYWNVLRASVLMILGLTSSQFKICCSVMTKRFPEFDLDAFVNTILDSDKLTLLETCALARYIISTEEDRILDDPVTVLDMWSHIQDTLLSTLHQRFLGDQEAISVAMSGMLCMSLLSILKSTGKQTSESILPYFGRTLAPI
ncbi:unnamed protein product [Rhizoctonia solani]|uniref:Uncharacterized protein n=1 Tax=Rhizoctonia solani TaxID=456999 RepID=A0A8H3AHR7_9AGAM|nr:unnamed protein product [Rhizoctonia solani]